MYKAIVITISDKGSQGLRKDTAGPALCEILKANDFEIIDTKIISDDSQGIKDSLIWACDERKADLVLTTGGTGFGPRDNTPEATKAVIEKEVPGIPEAIRLKSLEITPKAMLSRAAAGIRGKTLIINLPGSPKAVRESIEVVLPVLEHAVEILSGNTQNCGGNY